MSRLLHGAAAVASKRRRGRFGFRTGRRSSGLTSPRHSAIMASETFPMKRLATILASILVLTSSAPTLLSMPEYAYVETYYSDSSFQNVVGQRYYGCTGGWTTGTLEGYLNVTIFQNCSSGQQDDRGEIGDFGTVCNNGIDDDGDDLIDQLDPGCW
jgi:hypothetical protein